MLELDHAHQIAALNKNHWMELKNYEREEQLQFEGKSKDIIEKMEKTVSELNSRCNATVEMISDKLTKLEMVSEKISNDNEVLRTRIRDKDTAIVVLRKQLEEAKERDNQNLTEIRTMTSKLSSTRVEEEKREKESRDLIEKTLRQFRNDLLG